MNQKRYDAVVITGEYQKDGETKKRYKNVGAVWQNENGFYMTLDATFNPAGVPHDGDRIFVSLFEPKKKDESQHAGGFKAGGTNDPNSPGF